MEGIFKGAPGSKKRPRVDFFAKDIFGGLIWD